VMVGSHNTGGCLANGTLAHHRRSPAGTRVPVFARGMPTRQVEHVQTMDDVARLLDPGLRCSAAPRHDTFHYSGVHAGAVRMTTDEVAVTQVFIIALFLLLICVPCVMFDRSDWRSHNGRR